MDLSALDHEAGAHRVQRIPSNERKGRVHTSTVTVAVLDPTQRPTDSVFQQRQSQDFRMDWFNGTTKAGGQHHQKNATCCRLTHVPTGLVKTAQTRSRANSQKLAMEAMTAALDAQLAQQESQAVNGVRRAQMGDGQRAGVKRRTWRFQEDSVVDHITGRQTRAARAMQGRMDELWPQA